jgi:hypothetical protein
MISLERRLNKLEAMLGVEDHPTLTDVLHARLAVARQHPGERRPLPEGDDPLSRRLRLAMMRAQQARARPGDLEPPVT